MFTPGGMQLTRSNHARTALSILVSLTWFALQVCVIQGQPVVYPSPVGNRGLYIHDLTTGTLTRHPGGLRSFLCENCTSNVRVHTSSNEVEIVIQWLNAEGYRIEFPENMQIVILGSRTIVVDVSRTPTPAVFLTLDLTARRVRTELQVSTSTWSRSLEFAKDARPLTAEIEILAATDTANGRLYELLVSFSESVIWRSEPQECPEIPLIDARNVNASFVTELSDRCSNNLLENRIENGVIVHGGLATKSALRGNRAISVFVETGTYNRTTDIVVGVTEGYTDFVGNALQRLEERIIYYRPFPDPRTRQSRLLGRTITFPEKTRFSGKLAGQAATVAVAGASAATFASSGATGGSGAGSSITMLNNVQKLHMTGMLAVSRMPTNYQNFTGEVGWAVLDLKSPWEGNSTKRRNVTRTNQRSLKVVEAAFELQDDESEFQYFQRIMFWVPALFLVVILIHAIILTIFVVKEFPTPDLLEPPRLELMLAFFAMPPISIAAAGLFKSNRERALLGTYVLIAVPVFFIVWNLFMLWFYVLRLPPHMREVNLIMDLPNKKQRALRNVRRLVLGSRNKRVSHARMGSTASHPESMVSHRQSTGSQGLSTVNGSSRGHLAIEMTSQETSHRMPQRTNTMHREAVYEDEVGQTTNESESAQEAATCGEIFESLSNMTLLTLFVGEHQREAEWTTTQTNSSKFHARFGLLFEEHRGPAIGRRDVTYDVNPQTGAVDRGELVILRERPLLAIPLIGAQDGQLRIVWKRIYRYHLQLITKLLDISKTILVGCIVAGVGDTDDNVASIVALIALSLILILLLRLAKPFPSRVDMLMLLLAEVADLIVYTCALFLVLGPNTDEDTDENIGLALLLSECFALLAVIMEYTILSLGFGIEWYNDYKESKQHKFFKAAHTKLMQNEKYLQRKYLDRWMVRTFHRGLHGRIPLRTELPWKDAMKLKLRLGWQQLDWIFVECVYIWNDIKVKLNTMVDATRP